MAIVWGDVNSVDDCDGVGYDDRVGDGDSVRDRVKDRVGDGFDGVNDGDHSDDGVGDGVVALWRCYTMVL